MWPNPLFEPTRAGKAQLAFISFWANCALPVRAAQQYVRQHEIQLRRAFVEQSMVYVRAAALQDIEAIGRIIKSGSKHFFVDPEGAEARAFFASLERGSIEKLMDDKVRQYFVAEEAEDVVGMIMTRDNNYISQLFVLAPRQGKGIGRSLWRFALSKAVLAEKSGEFDVDSSLFAKPFYETLGFSVVSEPTICSGFKFISMHRAAESAA